MKKILMIFVYAGIGLFSGVLASALWAQAAPVIFNTSKIKIPSVTSMTATTSVVTVKYLENLTNSDLR
jgi:beta-lactam-binding protein with PASTA domain